MLAVVHYGEIGIKGGNRPFFENMLAKNIEKQAGLRVAKRYGRLLAEGDEEATAKLSNVFGVSYFAVAERSEPDIEAIKQAAFALASKEKENRDTKTFRIAAVRSDKNFPLTSQQINEEVGAYVAGNAHMSVDLTNPQLSIFIEITEKEALLYAAKQKGLGGLPVGCAGRVVALMSGGIDSPVAAFLAAKRGCSPILIHFHNYLDSKGTEKTVSIAKRLAEFIPDIKLYTVPFLFIQEAIINSVPDTHRMIVYRRLMFRIAEKIAAKENAKAFVTGDNLSQVASQTLENLSVIYNAAKLPVLAPLLGFDKNDIIETAKRIGTYELSIAPYQDCCQFMIAKHPATRATIEEINEMEGALQIEDLIEEAVEKADVIKF